MTKQSVFDPRLRDPGNKNILVLTHSLFYLRTEFPKLNDQNLLIVLTINISLNDW